MTKNMGTVDRALRALIGLGLLWFALLSGMAAADAAVLKYGAILIGLVMIGTAAMSSCPLYTLLGIRTCKGSS